MCTNVAGILFSFAHGMILLCRSTIVGIEWASLG